MPLAHDFQKVRLLGQFHIFKNFKNKEQKSSLLYLKKKCYKIKQKKDEVQDQSSIHVSQWLQQGAVSLCHSAITATFLLPTVCSEGSPTEIKLAGSYTARPSHHIRPYAACYREYEQYGSCQDFSLI